ncbi:MAG: hypothetical protein L0Y45_07360 [Woeseiaceae bacterium]|nr:hypothetical protein [Woeseiaceae bacterium]
MNMSSYWQRISLATGLLAWLGACAMSSQVTRVQAVSESAETPYKKILVISLFESFDTRRYLETEMVKQLSSRGTEAVAGTSMMDSKAPVNRHTLIPMVQEIGADAVMVTQLVSLVSDAEVKDMNPESTHIFRPTYYYNVWTYELTEYVDPKSVDFEHALKLATQLYAVSTQEQVWAIEIDSKIKQDTDHLRDYSLFVNEAETIVSAVSQDGLIAN